MELATAWEASGWDGFFLWDHVIRRRPWQPMVDPWVSLAAVAVMTDRIVLGPMVTPLARRRVSVVAWQSVTLDRLCDGRLRLGVGLGVPDDEFTRFGESADPKRRARLLDESLDALQLLWSGAEVSYDGDLVMVDDVEFHPTPVNGRIPIWGRGRLAGRRTVPPSRTLRRRVAGREAGGYLTVDQFVECVVEVRALRTADGVFDACFVDRSPGADDPETTDKIGRLVDGGMTWWIDSLDDPTIPFGTTAIRWTDRHADRRVGPPT